MKKFKLLFILFFSSTLLMAQSNVGLMAYYPFNNNANDASGNNNNGIVINAILTADRLGTPNSAYRFNGTSSFILIPNSSTLNTTNTLSLCAWVRPRGFYAGNCHGNSIMMKGNEDFLTGNYFLRYSDGPFLNFTNCSAPVDIAHQNFHGIGVTPPFPGSIPYIQQNQWYSVVATFDGITARLYVNCILTHITSQGDATFNNTSDLFLGRLNNNIYPYWLNGDLDEIRIYNRPLNQAEIDVFGGCAPPCPADITSNISKCINQNIVLNARTGSTYSWLPTTGLSSSTVQNPICFANTNTTYTVTITDSNCIYSDIFNVTVNPAPYSNIRDTSICNGDTLHLSATNGTSYSWTPNYNINNTSISNPLVWPTVTTNYIVNITNANGCSIIDTVTVTVSNCRCEDPCSWGLNGNLQVLNNNFIGSINNADFKIRTNNQQRMVVEANGDVGIGTTNPSKLLEVNGEARIVGLLPASINERIVFANTTGDLRALQTTGNTNQYLSGNGSWQIIQPGGTGIQYASEGLTSDGTTVVLGDFCNNGGGKFINNREVNMDNRNLYFNSSETGKLFMGNTADNTQDQCKVLYTRLEIGSAGLGAANNYDSPNPSTSGLRFTNLNSETAPIQNEYEGVLSLDKDGDVIWVNKCCNSGKEDGQLKDILERLTKLENDLKASKEEAILLKGQLSQMDVLLSKNNTIVLNQNIPNPFEENTLITYMIPKTFRQAQIIFTSMNGEVIKTAEIKQPGKGQVNVYAKDISSGLYTYTLIVDGKTVDTKKMIKQ